MYNLFGEVIEKGYKRGIGIVSGYTGKEFAWENYVSCIVVPIEDLDKEEIDRLNISGLIKIRRWT